MPNRLCLTLALAMEAGPATLNVQLTFLCGDGAKLHYTHALPTTLISAAQKDPVYRTNQTWQQLFVESIFPVIQQRYKEYYATIPRKRCIVCARASTHALTTPMSWLHKDPPFVAVLVSPVCKRPACDRDSRATIQEMILQEMVELDPHKSEALVALPCGVCGTTVNTRKCTGCGTLAYCSKEHQKAHWQEHKALCNSIKGANTA
ncbi:hypothetical protein EXIGLDRAFT_760274 [Exidia glandulosa HHB12029]|uniref:MYND-type domain-containing protein n=1 Tax=Exidia glandulosa HHB12029 TaxID=1314781 RepID=A0A165PEA1_EXIGL|nr:hypothetical protein EXIGLDRAFT_760274 [Exidia glandulosa HHB12029]